MTEKTELCGFQFLSFLFNSIQIKLACQVLKTLFLTVKRVLIMANGLISTIRKRTSARENQTTAKLLDT